MSTSDLGMWPYTSTKPVETRGSTPTPGGSHQNCTAALLINLPCSSWASGIRMILSDLTKLQSIWTQAIRSLSLKKRAVAVFDPQQAKQIIALIIILNYTLTLVIKMLCPLYAQGPRHIHVHNFMKMHTVHPQNVTHIFQPTNTAFPNFFLWLCHHPYPTGSLRRAAGQADGAVDRGELFPKTFHLPLGSLGSLGRKLGQVWLRGEGATLDPTLALHCSPAPSQTAGKAGLRTWGPLSESWAPELALGSPGVFGTPGGARTFPLH